MDEQTFRLKMEVVAADAQSIADRCELLEALAHREGWTAVEEALFAARVKANYITGRITDEVKISMVFGSQVTKG